jgi:DNA-binding IclR family transcriptional regulator
MPARGTQATVAATAATRKIQPIGRPPARYADVSGNRILEVGLGVLQAVAGMSAPATITEVARKTGMSLTRASRYMASLTKLRFLTQDEDTGQFELGPSALEIGIAAMARGDTIRIAAESMRALTEETQHASIVCIWSPNGPVVMRWEKGSLALSVHVQEGTHASLVATAAGLIFLAYLDPKDIEPVLDRDLKNWNRNYPKQRLLQKDVQAMRNTIVRHGMARAIGTHNPSLAAISAPIFGANGRLTMSITLVGMQGSIDCGYNSKPAQALKLMAHRLSTRFGAKGLTSPVPLAPKEKPQPLKAPKPGR